MSKRIALDDFNYHISNLEVDFYGDSKIDVFNDDELILEIIKIDDTLWLVQSFLIDDNMILIKEGLAKSLNAFLERKIKEKFNTELPVILHPNFFMSIDSLNSN